MNSAATLSTPREARSTWTSELGPLRLSGYAGESDTGVVALGAAAQTPDQRLVVKIPRMDIQLAGGFRGAFLELAADLSYFSHPGVVPIARWGEVKGLAYAATRWTPGRDIGALIRANRAAGRVFQPVQALSAVLSVAGALTALGSVWRGFSYRALRPSKVLLGRDGAVRLLPVTVTGLGLAGGRLPRHAEGLAWMAPEVLRGGAATPQSDVRGLALLAVAMCSGQNPFERADAGQTVAAVLREPCVDLSAFRSMPGLEEILAACLCARPEARPESPAELVDLLIGYAMALGGPVDPAEWRAALARA